jgi:hypothetical protein
MYCLLGPCSLVLVWLGKQLLRPAGLVILSSMQHSQSCALLVTPSTAHYSLFPVMRTTYYSELFVLLLIPSYARYFVFLVMRSTSFFLHISFAPGVSENKRVSNPMLHF